MVSRQQLEQSDDPVGLVAGQLIDLLETVPLEDQVTYMEGLSQGRRIVWGSFIVDCEVCNGGFNQLFWNDSRRYIAIAREAYQLLDATEHLQLLDDAVARLDDNAYRLMSYKDRGTLEAFAESSQEQVFTGLNERYFDLDHKPLLVRYIRSHVEEFID